MLRPIVQNIRYAMRGFQEPAPNWIKWKVLRKHFVLNGTCIETGTYLGETTAFLAKNYAVVFSLEPFEPLYRSAIRRFSGQKNVKIINKSSEDGFEGALREITGPANFWLDGHFSGAGTFEGTSVTPIELELANISKYRKRIGEITILVDDFRLFKNDGRFGYPSPDILVEYAKKNALWWTVEHDIFVMRSL